MKKNWKKVVGLVLVMVMAAGMLAGCGEQATSGDVTKVTVWTTDTHSQGVFEGLVEEYNNTTGKEKGIEIEYIVHGGDYNQNLEIALEAGTAPDMFMGGTFDKLVQEDKIVAIDDLPGGPEYLERFKDYLVQDSHIYDGKTYRVPFSVTTRGLVYNKDMFKAAGLVDENGEAKAPTTIAEVVEYAKKLTNEEKKEYGIILPLKWGDGWYHSDIWNLMLGSFGTDGYDYKTGTYNFEALAPIAQAYLDIKADGSYYPGAEGLDNDAARARFAEGGIGMKMAFSFDVGVFNDQFPAKCEWGVAPLPVVDADSRYLQKASGKVFCTINKESVEKVGGEKLMEVYKWFTSDETLAKLYENGVEIPFDHNIFKDVKIENPKDGWVEFSNLVAISKVLPPTAKVDITGNDIKSAAYINNVWTGNMTVEEFLAAYTDIYNEGMTKYKELHPEYDKAYTIIPDWDISIKE